MTLRDHTRADGREVVHHYRVERPQPAGLAAAATTARCRGPTTRPVAVPSMTTPDRAPHRLHLRRGRAGWWPSTTRCWAGPCSSATPRAGWCRPPPTGSSRPGSTTTASWSPTSSPTPQGSTRTLVSRSDEGRITGIDRDGETTSFDYDEACQLVEARSGTVTRWRFDAAGRLVAESRDGDAVEHAYDAAGQLVTSRSRRRQQHPPLLRPGRTPGPHRGVRRPDPRLRLVGDQPADRRGRRHRRRRRRHAARRTRVHVDATGELARGRRHRDLLRRGPRLRPRPWCRSATPPW